MEPHATVHAWIGVVAATAGTDRTTSVTREFEDVAAVVDAVADDSGSTVDLLGHSFGGLCAFGGAALTSNVRRLVLYEGWPAPDPDAWAMPPGVEARLDALLAEGNREAVLETFFREVVRMPDRELVAYRALPAWQARLAAAHTITRESRAEQHTPFDPDEAAQISVPTLLLVGGDSPDFVRSAADTIAAALPDARVQVIEGQQHIALDLVPKVFADYVVAFLRDRR